jgi:DNA-binding response OmpR family regulator
MASPVGLTDQEQALKQYLLARSTRVLTRTELAREVGLRVDQRRRVDAMLVSVRKALAADGVDLLNVRSRGWMINDPQRAAL